MNVNEKKNLRKILFRHLDGIALIPTVYALHKTNILKFIINYNSFTFKDIISNFKINPGYVNVALRILASQGWLNRKIISDGQEINFSITHKGEKMLQISNQYSQLGKHIKDLIIIEKVIFNSKKNKQLNNFNILLNKFETIISTKVKPNTINWEFQKHAEGIILGPILVALGMSNYFGEFLKNNNKIDPNIENQYPFISRIIKLFNILGWIQDNKFTNSGIFFIKRSSAYGVTTSYLPTFNQIPQLLIGNPHSIWERTKDNTETHVNRRMNVWGSGGAHSLYFKKIDEIIINLFNKPIKEQPLGIADMGCGDGTLLKHLHQVIKNNTIRGKSLNKNPLVVIGADFNKAARIASNITLTKAKIKHLIIEGDISDPKSYATKLKEKFNLNIKNMLNVRSFLDHNRIYSEPILKPENKICNSTGAFSFRGRWIPNYELKQNLIEHFTAWKQYIGKFGLLILELHTINPVIAANNLGRTLATPYDATHGYSDQYIFEIQTMLSSAEKAGLIPDIKHKTLFPSNKLATISINLFKPKI